MIQPDRNQTLAFRLNAHNLAARLPLGAVLQAAAACGIQDSPPGSAALSLLARVEALSPEDLHQARLADRTLLQTWSLRGAPLVFPSSDLFVFTLGAFPRTEDALHASIAGLLDPMIDAAGMTVTALVELVAEGVSHVLDGRVLTKRELGIELGAWMPRRLGRWFEPDTFYAANVVRLVSLTGLLCFAHRDDNEASFARTDQWLGGLVPKTDPDEARAELVRRYLRSYGPSVPEQFAHWAGTTLAEARASWGLIKAEMVEVGNAGGRWWLLRIDVPAFESPPTARGVRLLPPHDMFLNQPDRTTLLPETRLHKLVWRSAGNPGVVLVDGQVKGLWRPQKKGKKLVLTVTPFFVLDRPALVGLETEAELIAPFRDASSIIVTVGERP